MATKVLSKWLQEDAAKGSVSTHFTPMIHIILYFTSYFNTSIHSLLLIWVAEGGSRQLLCILNASKCPFKVSLCGI